MPTETKKYLTVLGFVQFDPELKEINDTKTTNVVINGIGLTKQPYVKITIWEKVPPLNKGDFIAVHGSYNQRVHDGKVYHNLNARQLIVLPSILGTSTFSKSSKDTQDVDGDGDDIF